MNRRNKRGAVFFLLLGVAVLAHSVGLGLTENREMGPGFFPFLSGGILVALAIVLWIQSAWGKGTTGPQKPFWDHREGRRWVTLTLAAIIAYIFILNHLGFLLSSFLLLFFLFSFRRSWWIAGAAGAGASLGAYLIFEVLLQSNLPRGFLGF